MNKIIRFPIGIFLLLYPCFDFAQAPDLGTAANFVLFSTTGAVSNTGISHITGNVGTNTGAITSFSNIDGVVHSPDAATGVCATDLQNAYAQLNAAIPTFFPGVLLGDGGTLTAGVYSIPAAASVNNLLILDGQGNQNAVFILQVGGAFSSGAGAEIRLINCARAENVFWKIEGAVSLAAGTLMKGTIIANNAAINLGSGVILEGRAFSTTGAVAVNNVLAFRPDAFGIPLLTGPVPPDLASASCYTLFSSNGLISNTGITTIAGNVGTNFGLVSGFDPLLIKGTIHPVPDGSTSTCASDMLNVYNYLNALPYDIELLYPAQFGNDLELTPHTYIMNGAVTLTGKLFLNAKGNANAVFVIRTMGSLVAAANSQVVLMNGAQARNVYWQVEGAATINNNSVFKGTIVCNNGAVVLNSRTLLEGRAFTTKGALTTTTITASAVPAASISYASYSYCSNAGTASVTFSGTSGGVYSSTAGLVINSATGAVNLGLSTPGNYVVTYSVIAAGDCLASSASAVISISVAPSATISYPGTPFYSNTGFAAVAFSGSPSGTYSSLPAGISINNLTGAVDLAASTPGSYTITYTITTCAGGCGILNYTTSAAIEIFHNTWKGGISADWNSPSNWASNLVPTIGCADVTILSGVPYQPTLSSGIATIQNIIINPGAILTVTGATLQLSGTIENSGTFNVSDGTIEMNGSETQTIPANAFQGNALKDLIIANSSSTGVILAGNLDIYGSLAFSGTGGKLTTNDSLTLKSSATNTAWVGDMTGNSIIGKVTVERYNSQHKAWIFLSIPTNTDQTIKQAWQEGGIGNGDNPIPGFGVQLTGPGGLTKGFDLYTATPSMKYYDTATGNWVGVANTDSLKIKNTEGYMVFVRGNRISNAFNAPVTESVLRTKGTLYTGDVGPLLVKPEKMASIGNPYASPIDFTKITKTDGIDDQFYLWDPLIPGSYNVGGYQTFSATNNWEPVPGGSTMYPTGVPNTTIQSGQAFFIHATTVPAVLPVNYEVTFGESSKIGSSGFSSYSKVRGASGTKSDKQFFRVSLFTGPLATDKIADGNAVAFGENYSSGIDGNDALKIAAGGENFDVKRNKKLLAVEARGFITNADTIYYNMSKLVARTYQLRFAPVNMGSGDLEAFLIDKYLNKTSPISLSDSTFINIKVNADATSKAADRFKVVFRTMAILPVTITTVQAKEEAENIAITWGVENEINMSLYVVEKSTNGISFEKTGEVIAKNLKSGEYKWLDQSKVSGYNYYRIRSVDINGKTSLTQVVKVLVGISAKASLTIYPNPIVNHVINVQMANSPAGKYQFKLLNTAGQLIMMKQVDFAGGNGNIEIKIDRNLTGGIYNLEITKPDGDIKVINVIK